MNIRRIRVDSQGLITQDAKGFIRRIPLSSDEIKKYMDNFEEALKQAASDSNPELMHFFDDEGHVTARIDVIKEDVGFLSRPLRIYYGVEPGCDLACPMCGPRDFHGQKTTEEKSINLNEDTALSQFADAGIFQLQLTGGEIALKRNKLPEIVKKAADFGFAVILSTNGVWSCINDKDKFIDDLIKYGNVIQVKISIEGDQKIHDSIRGPGTYLKIIDTLERFSKKGVETRLNSTLTKENCNKEQLEHMVTLAKKYGSSLQLIPLRPLGRATNLAAMMPSKKQLHDYIKHASVLRAKTDLMIKINFDNFDIDRNVPDDLIDYKIKYDLQSPFSCGAPLIGVHVTHKGEVYPCGFVQEVPELMCGQMSENKSIKDIWLHNEKLNEIRKAGKSEKCNECSFYGKTCSGGCWVMAWIASGKINGDDPYCLKEKI